MTLSAWYFHNDGEDQRSEHKGSNPEYVDADVLAKLGILYWQLNADDYESDPKLVEIRISRNYKNSDIIEINPRMLPNYEEKLQKFYEEHIHEDEEIRFILEGSGYFDFRNDQDRWIRCRVQKGDLIVLPAGCYHRFSLDQHNHTKAMRLFQDAPKWIAFKRDDSVDKMDARINYLRGIKNNS